MGGQQTKGCCEIVEDEFWDEKYKEKKGKTDIDAEAREVEFWDWKDMADKDFVAAEEALEKHKECTKGTKACAAEKKAKEDRKKANQAIDEIEHPSKYKEKRE